MDIDRVAAESAIRDYLRQFGRFENVEVTLSTHQVAEGWQIVVYPVNSYWRRHRRELTMSLFVDRTDGQVHRIPSFGLNGLVAQLRGKL